MTVRFASALFSRPEATSILAAAALTAGALVPSLPSQAIGTTVARRALEVAASKQGSPYEYGAAGPSRFDCSGLTLYAFRAAGRLLPRTATAQYSRTHHVAAASRAPGDLVFFHHGSSIYHVGIYAGHDRIWHASRAGSRVRLERIWTAHVWYGHVE
ncbi:C40 family peptidase [Streptantibioticus ferralitis]|uniref:C40 family peptidase n=1 Tax=Streptantibioticus ferralitis TaxID=236510 RepID=A0ABT5YUD9_9ACTN|nr:C40 family peptidase [Streptantibioticus ferralitis]MDF2254941.1 C40 family peptidase [Streptantibioticus ferralitis]